LPRRSCLLSAEIGRRLGSSLVVEFDSWLSHLDLSPMGEAR
jgi:hypothetical protein